MFEREGFIILTKAQLSELLAEVEAVYMAGFKEGYQAAEEAYEGAFDDGYDEGWASATEAFGYDYDFGYEHGYLDAAEEAAFEETPRIHSWTEGSGID